MQLVFSNQSVAGFALPNLLTARPELAASGLTDLLGRLAEGKLRVIAGDSFPLSEVAAAHAALEGRKTSGKVFLSV